MFLRRMAWPTLFQGSNQSILATDVRICLQILRRQTLKETLRALKLSSFFSWAKPKAAFISQAFIFQPGVTFRPQIALLSCYLLANLACTIDFRPWPHLRNRRGT